MRQPPRIRPLLELEIFEGGPAGVDSLVVLVIRGIGVVEGLAADGAEAGAVRAAEEAAKLGVPHRDWLR